MAQEKTKMITIRINKNDDIMDVLLAQKSISRTLKALLRQHYYRHGNVDYFEAVIKNESEKPDVLPTDVLEETPEKISVQQDVKEPSAPEKTEEAEDVKEATVPEAPEPSKDANDFRSIFNASRQKSESMEKRKHSDINLDIFG